MKNSNDVCKVTLRMSSSEKQRIDEKATLAKKSVNRYLIDLALESETVDRAELFRQAQRLVQLQRQIDAIEHEVKKQELRKECAAVWSGFVF